MTGYSIFTQSKATKKDMEIQKEIEKALDETMIDLEDEYGLIIDLTYSWDYYKEQEEEQ